MNKFATFFIYCLLFNVQLSYSSGLPQIDSANLGTNILENLREMFQQEEMIEFYKNTIDMNTSFNQMELDAENNAWANTTIRTNQHKTDVHNKKVESQSMPAFVVCPILLSVDDFCFSLDKEAEMEDADLEYVDEVTAKNKSNVRLKSTRQLIDDLLAKAKQSRPQHYSKKNTSVKNAQSLNVLNPYYLISNVPSTSYLSSDDASSISSYIDLIAPPYVASYRDSQYEKLNNKILVRNLRNKSFKAYPRQILQKLLAKRMMDSTGMSELQRLDSFVEQHFSKGSFSMDTVASKVMLSNVATPGSLLRNRAVMKAFQVHMALERYKASLQSESLSAISLGFKIN